MKKTILTLVLAGLATTLFAQGKEPTQEELQKIRALYTEAVSLQMRKEYAKSNENLEQILKLLPVPAEGAVDPNFARVHYDMAGNHSSLGKKKEALESMDRAIKHGFCNADSIARDQNFNGLRDDKDFKAVVDKCRRALADMPYRLKDLAGKDIQKKDYEGKVVVIDVWGTWCPPCRMEIPSFVKLQEKYGKDGLAIIGLCWEKSPPDENIRKKVEKFVADNKINYTVALISPEVLGALPGVGGFPTKFFVGRDGVVAERITGMLDERKLEAKVTRLLAEKPPAPEGAKTSTSGATGTSG